MKNPLSWLLRNPWVLGILAVVSALHVIYYSQTKKNMMYAVILVTSGAVASFFSRNMVVILLFALGITHLVWFSQRNMCREGMETIIDPSAEEDNTVLVSTSEAEATSADPTVPMTDSTVTADSKPPSAVPDMLEMDPPTAMDRKLEDLQLKIDKLQTELSSIQTITATP
jgi:hypothetical protein